MNITIKHQSIEAMISETILVYNKDSLQNSPYMTALFEHTNCGNNIDIDVSFIKYLSEDHIKLVFQLEFGDYSKMDHVLYTPKTEPKLVISIGEKQNTCDCALEFHLPLAGVSFMDLPSISTLVDYLQFDKAGNVFKQCLGIYASSFDRDVFASLFKIVRGSYNADNNKKYDVDIFNDILSNIARCDPSYCCVPNSKPKKTDPYVLFLKKLSMCVEETCTIRLEYIRGTSMCNEINDLILTLYYNHFKDTFKKNISIIYSTFISFRMAGTFYRIFNYAKHNRSYCDYKFEDFDIPPKKYKFVESDLEIYDLKDIYNLVKMNAIIKQSFLDPNIDVYKYYNLLGYESPTDIFSLWSVTNLEKSVKHQTIIPYDVALEKFKQETGGIFNGFNWNDAQISGSFIYNLLNNISTKDTIIDIYCSDLDVFDNVITYFLNIIKYSIVYDYSFIDQNEVYHYSLILDCDYSFHIRVISHPYYFCFRYEPILFDGSTFKATIEGLIMLKYKMTNKYYQPDLQNMLESGLFLDAAISGKSPLQFDSNVIDFAQLEPSLEIALSEKVKQIFTVKDFVNEYSYLRDKFCTVNMIVKHGSELIHHATGYFDRFFTIVDKLCVSHLDFVLDECKAENNYCDSLLLFIPEGTIQNKLADLNEDNAISKWCRKGLEYVVDAYIYCDPLPNYYYNQTLVMNNVVCKCVIHNGVPDVVVLSFDIIGSMGTEHYNCQKLYGYPCDNNGEGTCKEPSNGEETCEGSSNREETCGDPSNGEEPRVGSL